MKKARQQKNKTKQKCNGKEFKDIYWEKQLSEMPKGESGLPPWARGLHSGMVPVLTGGLSLV